MGFILLLHLVASFIFFPPWEALRAEPLFFTDHPVHTHRVYVYREALWESGLPWGYDPAVGAGKIMTPREDVGAKPQEVFGVILGFIAPAGVERLFLFIIVLIAPLGTLLACRRLGFGAGTQACIMATMLPVIWRVVALYFSWGLVAFAAASLLVSYVIVLFLDFSGDPGFKRYIVCVAAASGVFLFHALGLVVIAPSLVLLTLGKRDLPTKWRIALVCVPVGVALINSFWLAPFLLAHDMPIAPREVIVGLNAVEHLTAMDWSQVFGRVYFGRVVYGVVAITLGAYGLAVLYRAVTPWAFVTLVTAAAVAVSLRLFGSFVPTLAPMQPLRFILPAVVVMTIPAGLALQSFGRKCGLRSETSALLMGFAMIALALGLGQPHRLPLPPDPDPFGDFIAAHTTVEDRLLVQSLDGYRYEGYEAKAFPIAYNREVIGNAYPATRDPAQFHRDFLWGKALSGWQPNELRATLVRWGVTWVFAQTNEAHALLVAATGASSVTVGGYRAFQVPSASTSRFLVGRGRVAAQVNRFDLSDVEADNGLIVLRYRYHPAWRSDGGQPIRRYPVPEDTTGFIAVENPGRNVTLHFDPAVMLRAPWPDPMPVVPSKQNSAPDSNAGLMPLDVK